MIRMTCCAVKNLAVVAGGRDHLGSPVVRKSERLGGGEIVAEELVGPHVIPLDGLGHIIVCDTQRLGLNQGVDRPIDDEAKGLIAIAIGGNDRIYRKPLGQENEVAGLRMEIGARLRKARFHRCACSAATHGHGCIQFALLRMGL